MLRESTHWFDTSGKVRSDWAHKAKEFNFIGSGDSKGWLSSDHGRSNVQ